MVRSGRRSDPGADRDRLAELTSRWGAEVHGGDPKAANRMIAEIMKLARAAALGRTARELHEILEEAAAVRQENPDLLCYLAGVGFEEHPEVALPYLTELERGARYMHTQMNALMLLKRAGRA